MVNYEISFLLYVTLECEIWDERRQTRDRDPSANVKLARSFILNSMFPLLNTNNGLVYLINKFQPSVYLINGYEANFYFLS